MPSSTSYKKLPDENSTKPTIAKRCIRGYGLLLLTVVVVVALLQEGLFLWATMNCKASALKDYSFPGGGPDNLVGSSTLLIEQTPRRLSSSFLVQPADKVGLATGASTGIWYRTWGPLFWTYVYQDNLGHGTFWARDRPLALGASHKVARCDGTGPVYIVNEGNHVVMNAIRHWFGMYTSKIYNIRADGNLIAIAEEIGGAGQSHKQLIFREPEQANPFASSFLATRHYHGEFDKWFIHEDTHTLPAWVVNAGTVLKAFPTAVAKEKAAVAAAAKAKGPEPSPGEVEASKLEMAEVPEVKMASAQAMREVPVMAEIPVQLEQHI